MGVNPDRIQQNLAAIRKRITNACDRAGRKSDGVKLVAVTKSVGIEETRILHGLGENCFGENRAPACFAKVESFIEPNIEWHFIGHLQRNKAGKIIELFNWLHGVDSSRLLKTLQDEATRRKIDVNIFLEVNISGEDSKYGIAPTEVGEIIEEVGALDRINLHGLMTMAPWSSDMDTVRSVFRGLRNLRNSLQAEKGIGLPYLSMGMSNDFEIAIEEGATHIRVGSALFE